MPHARQASNVDDFLDKLVKTDAYNYFLALNQMGEGALQEMLARVLLFLVEASGEPVLLSMLVLIFSDGDESMSRLPSSRLELYETALSEAIKRRLSSAGSKGGEDEQAEAEASGEAAEAKEKEVKEKEATKKEAKEASKEDEDAKAEARKAARKAGTSSFMGNKTTKFSTETKSVDLVFAEYGHVRPDRVT